MEVPEYTVVLAAPSLGTGIDITFENGESKIDCVYGIFDNQINSHFETHQHIAESKHPKEVNMRVSPETFRFETDFGVVVE